MKHCMIFSHCPPAPWNKEYPEELNGGTVYLLILWAGNTGVDALSLTAAIAIGMRPVGINPEHRNHELMQSAKTATVAHWNNYLACQVTDV